jgi:hypothetical protein
MTKNEEMEKLVSRKKAQTWVCIVVLAAGIASVLASVVFIMLEPLSLMDRDHITDQDMPIRDYDNVTYTWSAEELADRAERGTPLLLIGLGMFLAGYAFLFVLIDDKQVHRLHCTGDGEWKYCPECGLKLSRLEKK